MVNILLLTSLLGTGTIAGTGAPCEMVGNVCAYQSNQCAIYLVRGKALNRLLLECKGQSLQVFQFDSRTHLPVLKRGLIEISIRSAESIQITTNRIVQNASLYALWSGDVQNIFSDAGVKDELSFISSAKRNVGVYCQKKSSKENKKGKEKPIMCDRPLNFFIQSGAVGAIDGKFWFLRNGSLKDEK